MSTSSIMGGEAAPSQASGKDVDALGPSDTSDSGSDVQGERSMSTEADNPGEWGALVTDADSDSDAMGTGERASADGDAPRDGADILPDRIVDSPDEEVSMDSDSVEIADIGVDDGDVESEDADDDAETETEAPPRGRR